MPYNGTIVFIPKPMNVFLRSFAFFFLVSVLAVPVATLAESPEGVQLNPAIFEDRVDPGNTYEFVLKARNVSEVEKTFYLSVKDITGIDEGGRPQFATEGEPTPYNLSSWITVSADAITIPGGVTQSIPFTVTVPSDATPGSHFGSIFLDVIPPRLRTTGAAVGVSVGSLINLQISGDIVEDARLRSFATGKLVYNTLPATFEVRFENLGNTLMRPAGFVSVVDMFGKEVANVRINESGAGVFPQSDRSFTVEWNQDGLVFGRYQALLSLVYGDDVRKTISASTSFWVLPVQPIMVVLGVLIGLTLLFYILVRLYIAKKLREMGVDSSKKSRGALYEKKYKEPLSKITLAVGAVVVFCVVFLGVLLVMFA